MTVISFLDLDGKSGIACSDERVTYGQTRTYDFYVKLYQLTPAAVTGYAGDATYAKEIFERVKESRSPETYRDALSAMKSVYREVKDEKIEDYLLGRFFLTREDVKTLKRGSNNELAKEVLERLRSGDMFNVLFIMGGYDTDNRKFRIHTVGYPGHVVAQDIFATIGSGSDRAHRDIGDAIQRMPPHSRRNIEPYDGAKILIRATHSAWHNEGVGGSAQLMLLNERGINEIGRKESDLLTNVIYCEERGILDAHDTDSVFQRIVQDGAKAGELLDDLTDKVGLRRMSEIFWTDSLHI